MMTKAESEALQTAEMVATVAHEGQADKGGTPYILHPLAVARTAEANGFEIVHRVVALLHDVVEDCDYTLDDLRRAGFAPEVVEAVDAISQRKGETYFAFIARCAENAIARTVKVFDILHNLSAERAGKLPRAHARSLAKRYCKALGVLGVA